MILSEISAVNDDNVDNRFYEAFPRLIDLIEDESPVRLLFSDYSSYKEKLNQE